VTLADGERVGFRPLAVADSRIFARYLAGASDEMRGFFSPHPFDEATAKSIASSPDPARVLRMLATVGSGPDERSVAYFILKLQVPPHEIERYAACGYPLDERTTASVAPSVADDYQDRGLGSALMRATLDVARRLGKTLVVLSGGVQARNSRAIHFYAKQGFESVGRFETGEGDSAIENIDMALVL
jgi:GNAT superfamily N-acetyltransferase